MQEENQENKEIENSENSETSTQETQAQEIALEHIYFEVGNDLTSKPNALADLIQAAEYPHVQIVCNSPSEADFVDVILKKRNIACGKLIGHVPYTKISQTLHQLSTGAINVVIVTDVSANEIDPGQFDVSINYAIHEDPEIYLHRCTPHAHDSKLRKVLSLVGPLDFGNFHYLKKVVDFEFTKGTLPSKEEVAKGEAEKFFTTALQNPFAKDPKLQSLVTLVKEHPECDTIIAYLLHNSLVVLPDLSSRNSRGGNDEGDDTGRRDRRNDRNSRYGNERSERRYDDRGHGRYSSREESRYDDSYDPERRSSHQSREEYVPPKRDVRFYLGHGLKNGLTDRSLRDILETEAGVTSDQIKRLSIRDNYAFIDFDEESADEIIEKLQTIDFPEVGQLFIRKATVINAPRSANDADEESLEEREAEASEEAWNEDLQDEVAENDAEANNEE